MADAQGNPEDTQAKAIFDGKTIVTTDNTVTVTNKTVDLDANTLTGTLAEFNTALQSESFVSLAGIETVTNKTIDLDANTLTGTLAEFNTALQSESFVSLTGIETVTNKTVDLDANTLTGTLAEFNTALQSESFVSLTGIETVTNKTFTAPTITGVVGGTQTSATITTLTAPNIAGAVSFNNALSGITTLSTTGDLDVADTKKIFLDGGGDTYLHQVSANVLEFIVGGNSILRQDTVGMHMTTWPTTGAAATAHVADGNYIRRSTSSIRYKHDINEIDLDTAEKVISSLRPITYRSKTDEDQRPWPGFVAEEASEVDPILVQWDENDMSGREEYVNYDRVPVYLVKVIQDLMVRIDELERLTA